MGLFKSKEWVEVADTSEFDVTDRKLVDLGGDKKIGLFKQAEKYYAIGAYCSHQKTSMVHGDLSGFELTCPLHGARFDLRNGHQLCLPAVKPVPSYKVKVQDEKVYVMI